MSRTPTFWLPRHLIPLSPASSGSSSGIPVISPLLPLASTFRTFALLNQRGNTHPAIWHRTSTPLSSSIRSWQSNVRHTIRCNVSSSKSTETSSNTSGKPTPSSSNNTTTPATNNTQVPLITPSKWWGQAQQETTNYVQYLYHSTTPNMPHIPSRREIIASVQGFWTRQYLRVRLFLTGHLRPWKTDDFLAVFSWMLVGNVLWVLIGTTGFVSIVLLIANSVQGQEWLARKLSHFLAAETGMLITFESAIVPRWKDGTIRLKNVNLKLDGDTYRDLINAKRKQNRQPPITQEDADMDLNWTYWDVNIQYADVSLSLWRYLDGKGIIKDASIRGVRGTIHREHIHFDPNWVPTRRQASIGDLDIEKFQLEDVLLEIRNPGFRPYNLSIYHADAPKLRFQWLLYDILGANSVVGMFDGCLFSVHKPQTREGEQDDEDGRETRSGWAKMSHFKINGVPIAHMNQGAEGPFGWITGGTLDMDVHILIPQVSDHTVLALLKDEIQELRHRALELGDKAFSRIEGVIRVPIQYDSHRTGYHRNMDMQLPGIMTGNMRRDDDHSSSNGGVHMLHDVVTPALRVNSEHSNSYNKKTEQYTDIPFTPPPPPNPDGPPYIRFFFDVRLNDLRASIPLTSPDLTYLNSALVRPVVAYMNANKTITPMVFGVQMDLTNFDGAWDIYAAGLADVLSEEVGRCFTHLVTDERERAKRLRRVGLWSLRSVSKNIVTLSDYLRGTKGFPEFVGNRGALFGQPWYG
ncbi:hypothetical protein SmJEL517_g01848 [Synchytrium microbalum]|uniref:Mitochondrial distribution and morphology protein family 31/32 n=1 Tax=Synchytrium microbalum TaxID=1806994 RepID=A0A507C8R3_9FUNG|nr:uncharacterized protein SmJEL517_g01848 [Synchytrium microbalum]TPX35911.1 hypothetical protein SmJEL517_g01848 [Synchytrium microbalum]